jgi:hypothetical protein
VRFTHTVPQEKQAQKVPRNASAYAPNSHIPENKQQPWALVTTFALVRRNLKLLSLRARRCSLFLVSLTASSSVSQSLHAFTISSTGFAWPVTQRLEVFTYICQQGIGVIIAGVMTNNTVDIVIGVLQLVLFFVGWIWAVIWGILMMVRAC